MKALAYNNKPNHNESIGIQQINQIVMKALAYNK